MQTTTHSGGIWGQAPMRPRLKNAWNYYTDDEWRASQAELDWVNDGHLGEYDKHDWTSYGPNWDH